MSRWGDRPGRGLRPFPAIVDVLNALRHQRFGHLQLGHKLFDPRHMCSTPYGIRGLDTLANFRQQLTKIAVLNALRHQRFGHGRLVLLLSDKTNECSTPYGIRGLDTDGGCDLGRRGLDVLNALRHQRFGHSRQRQLS